MASTVLAIQARWSLINNVIYLNIQVKPKFKHPKLAVFS